MKVSINGIELFTLGETKKKVLQHELIKGVEEDLAGRIIWVVMHGYHRAFKRFKEEWDPKLVRNGIKMIPTDPDEYAELVFSLKDYQPKHG
jgi:hypothetical protein